MNIDNNIKLRKTTVQVRGMEITFDEYYKIDSETGEEIFDRDLTIENDIKLYDIYKKKNNLLTSSEIKSIRNKYGMNQKEYAFALGLGEVTINRFENGSIQTGSTNSIIILSSDPNNMLSLLRQNQCNLPPERYAFFVKKIEELIQLKDHRIAKFDKAELSSLSFKTEDINLVTDKLIQKYNKLQSQIIEEYGSDQEYEEMTQLKLQKLLYFIQGLSLHIFEKPAFTDKIYNWTFGPVEPKTYKRYKSFKKNPIPTPKKSITVSEGLDKIIDIVINSYGKYTPNGLITLTHNEAPWIDTQTNCEISQESIKEYFDKVYYTI